MIDQEPNIYLSKDEAEVILGWFSKLYREGLTIYDPDNDLVRKLLAFIKEDNYGTK